MGGGGERWGFRWCVEMFVILGNVSKKAKQSRYVSVVLLHQNIISS